MTATISNDLDVISGAVLDAARSAVAANRHYHIPHLFSISPRNADLVILLEALLDGALATASAIADNAWDEGRPLPAGTVRDVVGQAQAIVRQVADLDRVPSRMVL